MADDKDGSFIIHQEVFQPDDAVQVQVVCRLVQQDNVGMAEQSLRKQHFDLQTRVDVAHQVFVQGNVHAESLQDPRSVAFGFPAAQFRKFLFELGSADPVLITEVFLVVDGVLLFAAVVKTLVSHDDGVENCKVVIQALVLLQHGHSALRIQNDGTACRLQFSGEDLDESGFSGAVCPDDSVAVAGGKLQVDFAEKYGRPELHGKIIDCQHFLTSL